MSKIHETIFSFVTAVRGHIEMMINAYLLRMGRISPPVHTPAACVSRPVVRQGPVNISEV